MCGMSGAAGSLFNPEKSAVEHLMTMNIPRGPHSTGLATVPRVRNQHQNVITIKELGTPFGDGDGGSGLRGHKNYDKAMRQQSCAILTHNRWATKGAISRKNAHPFWFPNLVGTHNGTLDYSYKNKLLRAEQYETDSECLFNSMNCWGVRKAIQNTEGAYALVWYDLERDTLNMLRNDKRPMHYTFSSDKKVLFWSSDFHALAYGLEQARITRGEEKIKLLTPDTWLSWAMPDPNQAFDEPTRETLKGYEYKWTHTFKGGNSNFGQQGFQDSCAWDGWKSDESSVVGGETDGTSESAPSKVDQGTEDDSKDGLINYGTYTVNRSTVEIIDRTKTPKVVGELEAGAEKRFDEQFSSPLLKNTSLVLKGDTPFKKCYYDKKEGVFEWYEYLTLTNKWMMHRTPTPPVWLPYRLVDVESGGSHLFSYQKRGRGKKKVRNVYYKGYQGNLLPQERFSEIMAEGCLNCTRSPIWGNEVKFIDNKTFLCEHCTTPHLESLWKKSA